MTLLYTDPLFLSHETGRHPECPEGSLRSSRRVRIGSTFMRKRLIVAMAGAYVLLSLLAGAAFGQNQRQRVVQPTPRSPDGRVNLATAPGEKGHWIRTRRELVVDANTAIVTYPVDVWFGGSKTFRADLDFGGRSVLKVMLDPSCRFPDHDPSDNVWPRSAAPAAAPARPTAVPASAA